MATIVITGNVNNLEQKFYGENKDKSFYRLTVIDRDQRSELNNPFFSIDIFGKNLTERALALNKGDLVQITGRFTKTEKRDEYGNSTGTLTSIFGYDIMLIYSSKSALSNEVPTEQPKAQPKQKEVPQNQFIAFNGIDSDLPF